MIRMTNAAGLVFLMNRTSGERRRFVSIALKYRREKERERKKKDVRRGRQEFSNHILTLLTFARLK